MRQRMPKIDDCLLQNPAYRPALFFFKDIPHLFGVSIFNEVNCMKIANDITELIGKTPLIRLSRYCDEIKVDGTILAKAECFNAASSVKDRVGKELIEDAERSGRLKSGGTVIEPTSGNTGVGLALVCAIKGYSLILTMPENMSIERKKLLKALGAQLVLTPAEEGMPGAMAKAQELLGETDNAIIAGQFINKANPQAHRKTTAPEIWEDTDGTVDIFVAGVGTGGTIMGVGSYLKEKNPNIKIVAVEPANSAVLSGKPAGRHGLQGIGAGFVPEILDVKILDEIIPVTEGKAYEAARTLAKKEGLLCGITSGAALHAAGVLASRPENKGKIIVVLLPDTGERYMSTDLFEV